MSNTTEELEVNVLNPKFETTKERRRFLRELSNSVKGLVGEDGEHETVNSALLVMYHDQEGQEAEFNSYRKWRKLGYQVKKGESAFLVWGRPQKIEDKDADPEEEQEGTEFFPVAYLFSSKQVQSLKKGGDNV